MAKKISKKQLIILISVASAVLITLTTFIIVGVVIGRQFKSIRISSTPYKLEYNVGDNANYDGLLVQITRKNGKINIVDSNSLSISGFDSSKAGVNTIIVNYGELTVSFNVTIKDLPPAQKVLKSISIKTLPKTNYILGEDLDTNNGELLITYTDNSTDTITLLDWYISGFYSITESGTYDLKVIYVEGGVQAETSYTITVSE